MAKAPVLVVLNDLHSGSSVALMPENFVDHKQNVVGRNPIQKFLGKCWENATEFIYDTVGADPFSLILNGDCIEGVHHKTKEIISSEVADHVNCFVELITPLRSRAAKCYMVSGTEAHTGNTEMTLATILGAEKNPDTGGRTFDRLSLDAHNVRMTVRHHMATSVRTWTESSGPGAELANEQLEAVRNGEPMPRILCLAHRHRFGAYHTGEGLVVVGAPWQMLTRFGHKVVGSARTKPGVFILDWRKRGHSELPEVHYRIYKAPQPQALRA